MNVPSALLTYKEDLLMEKKHNRYEKPVLEQMDLVGEGVSPGECSTGPTASGQCEAGSVATSGCSAGNTPL